MDYCVYMHTSPSGKRYVGITSKSPKRRWRNGTSYRGNTYFNNAIRKYGWDNFRHEVLFENIDEFVAKRIEQILIVLFRSADSAYGYNLTLGGESAYGWKHSDLEKKKMSESHMGEKNYFYGKTHTEQTLKKLSEASTGNKNWVGRHHTEESKQKIRLAHLGKPSPTKGATMNQEQRDKIKKAREAFYKRDDAVSIMRNANPNKKQVYQYDESGKLIKIWESRHHAENEFNPDKKSLTIGKCCQGDCDSAYGFIWSYQPLSYIKPIMRERKVYQYDRLGCLVQTWDSLSSAINEFRPNKKSTVIGQCVTGHRSIAYGFIWSYSPPECEGI